jgi:hypothetical protein
VLDPEDFGHEDLKEEDEANDATVVHLEMLSRRDIFHSAIRQANMRLGNLGLAFPPVANSKSTPMGLPSPDYYERVLILPLVCARIDSA